MWLRAEHFTKCIKDQSDEILTMHVLRLQKQKSQLKRKIEYHQIGKPRPLMESDALKINRYRQYIQDTLFALDKIGKAHLFIESRFEAIQFQKSIPFISRLDFYIGGYLGGLERYEIVIENDRAYITYSLSDTPSVPPVIIMEPDYMSKKEFIAFMYSLHMGEWQNDYCTNRHNYMMLDSIVWEVNVYYENDLEMKEFSGLNVFPYNFSLFQSFFESHKKKVDMI